MRSGYETVDLGSLADQAADAADAGGVGGVQVCLEGLCQDRLCNDWD